MLGNLAKLFLQYGDVASANAIIIKVHTLKNQLSSFFPVATLNKFYESCIERQDSAMALVRFYTISTFSMSLISFFKK